MAAPGVCAPGGTSRGWRVPDGESGGARGAGGAAGPGGGERRVGKTGHDLGLGGGAGGARG